MGLSDRIRQLRVERHWTQADLGAKVGVHQKQISSYERGVHTPTTEVLLKLAEAFNVTVDRLALEAHNEPAAAQTIQDRELMKRLQAIDNLPSHEKNLAIEVLDLLILKHRFQQLAGDGPFVKP